LERFLFDLRLEGLHLRRSEFLGDAFVETVRVARVAGVIVLYSGGVLSRETKDRIALEFDIRFLDVAGAPELPFDEEQAVRHVQAFARSLWFVDEQSKIQQKVN